MPIILVLIVSLTCLIGCGGNPTPTSTHPATTKAKKGQSPWALPSGERIHPDEECTESEQETDSPFAYNKPWITDKVAYSSMNTQGHLNQDQSKTFKAQPHALKKSKKEIRYRYISRLYGGTSRVDSYCSNETKRDHYNQPTERLLRRCKSKSCGEFNISSRGSLEPAFFLAILDHEVKRETKLAKSSNTFQEETQFGPSKIDTYVQMEQVNFHLNAHTKCAAQIKLYSDQYFVGYSRQFFRNKIKSLHINATPISGELYMTHTYTGKRYEVLLNLVLQVLDNQERGQYEYNLLCTSKKHPIHVLKSQYKFYVSKSKTQSEWVVQARRKH
jgi:hypothetical protein